MNTDMVMVARMKIIGTIARIGVQEMEVKSLYKYHPSDFFLVFSSNLIAMIV